MIINEQVENHIAYSQGGNLSKLIKNEEGN